jgi:hypothetical protein
MNITARIALLSRVQEAFNNAPVYFDKHVNIVKLFLFNYCLAISIFEMGWV